VARLFAFGEAVFAVTAFSLMADAVRDALDPKLRGLE
jgi:ABC-type dipeptide/oligopeptide/nickel transport system permease subunit